MSNTNNSIIVNDQVDLITFVTILNKQISIYGMAFVWLIGNTGSIIDCLIFSQPTLRKNSCVMYFLASSASQFVTFNFVLLTRTLQFGFNVQALSTLRWYCKIRFYFFYTFVAIPRYYIVLASIDRYFASSIDISWRRWSSPKIASRLIIATLMFWLLIYIQVLVFYDIQSGDCSYQTGAYGIFFSIYLSIESGILPPLMMLIFGSLTLRNIRKSKERIRPLEVPNTGRRAQFTGISRHDLQISKMVINQVFLWTILNILNPCYLLYRTITIDVTKSSLRLTVELLVNNISYLLIHLEFSLTFFVYTLSSPLFRREVKQLIHNKILRRFT